MSGDVTIQSLKRLTFLPERDIAENGQLIAGQYYYDVYFAGGYITNVTIDTPTFSAPVSVPNGGTGVSTLTGIVKGNGTANFTAAAAGTDYTVGTASLATGIVKSTTGTGALTIAVAGDFPTLNQSTTGNAATATLAANATKLATARAINGINFDGTAAITITAAAGTLTGTALNATIVSSSLTSISSGISGLVKSTAGALSAAISGTDYQAPGNYITALTGDVTASGPGSATSAIKSNVALSGNPTTTTQAATDNSTNIATTAFVVSSIKQNIGFSKIFTATGLTLTAGATTNQAHGLGTAPFFYFAELVCTSTTGSQGYAVGDRISASDLFGNDTSGAGYGGLVFANATNIGFQVGSAGILLPNKSGGSIAMITLSSFTLSLKAWA